MNKLLIIFLFGTLLLNYVNTQTLPTAMSGLHVSGNRIYNGAGQEVRLRGVNRPGTEYSCVQYAKIFDGPADQASVDRIRQWKINSVRVPINEDCWMGSDGISAQYSGSIYQKAIVDWVNLLSTNSLAVIVDLHWASNGTNAYAHQQIPMPSRSTASDLWKSVANTFKGNSAVIFDIYNEPFPDNNAWDTVDAWNCWKYGGSCPGVSYQCAGMDELVAAVRSTGATNIVMVGGLQYATSLVRFLEFMPTDDQLAAAVHVYDFNFCKTKGCWDIYWRPVFEKIPLIAGETGQTDCGTDFITEFMHYADDNGIGYIAWAWLPADCATGPSLITDFNGTPSNFGLGYDTHLQNLAQGITYPWYNTFNIYKDASTYWVADWSAKGDFLNMKNNNTVHSGKYSIAFSAGKERNLMWMCWDCFNTTEIRGVELWVHGAGNSNQNISINFFSLDDLRKVYAAQADTTIIYPTISLASTLKNGISPTTWQVAYIDMSLLPAGVYDGITFTSEDGTTEQPFIYLDDVRALAVNDDGSDHTIPPNTSGADKQDTSAASSVLSSLSLVASIVVLLFAML